MQEPSSGEQGRIGIQVETTSFAVTPGGRVTIPIVLSNHGLEGDALTLAVDGIPTSWAFTSSASTLLTPGQAQEVALTIQPPRSLQAGAGRHPFRIQVTSQMAPGQVFEVECILSIAVFAEFSSELRPQRVKAGEPARVTVENRGNIQQAFTLTCQSPNDALSFEPGPSQELRVPPGEVAMAEFQASPRNRPFFGGEVTFPFTARVQSADMAVQNHNGEAVGRALIPSWVIPVVLVLIMATACVGVLLILGLGSQDAAPAVPAATSTPSEGQPAPTELPPEAPTEALPTEAPPEAPTEAPPTEAPTEAPPVEPPPEQTAEPPPEQPTEPPPPEQPTDEAGKGPGEPDLPCLPLASGLILAPLLVGFKKREL
jgi:hypothetical protein